MSGRSLATSAVSRGQEDVSWIWMSGTAACGHRQAEAGGAYHQQAAEPTLTLDGWLSETRTGRPGAERQVKKAFAASSAALRYSGTRLRSS